MDCKGWVRKPGQGLCDGPTVRPRSGALVSGPARRCAAVAGTRPTRSTAAKCAGVRGERAGRRSAQYARRGIACIRGARLLRMAYSELRPSGEWRPTNALRGRVVRFGRDHAHQAHFAAFDSAVRATAHTTALARLPAPPASSRAADPIDPIPMLAQGEGVANGAAVRTTEFGLYCAVIPGGRLSVPNVPVRAVLEDTGVKVSVLCGTKPPKSPTFSVPPSVKAPLLTLS
jgi:hypothetical protein